MVSKSSKNEKEMRSFLKQRKGDVKKEEKAAKKKAKQQSKKGKESAVLPSIDERKARQAKREAFLQNRKRSPLSKNNDDDDENTTLMPSPPFSYDVNLKLNKVIVVVTLHKIPPSCINVEETTTKRLVIDTSRYSKKLRLDWPFPNGVSVDIDNAQFNFDSGILRCIFPISKMSNEAKEDLAKGLERVTDAAQARFRTSVEGNLVIRTRNAVVVKDLEGNKVVSKKRDDGGTMKSTLKNKPMATASTKATKKDDEEEDEDEGSSGALMTKETKVSFAKEQKNAAAATSKSSKRQRENQDEEDEDDTKESSHAAAAAVSQKAEKKKKGKKLVDDGESAMRIAKEVGIAAKQNMKMKIQQLKEEQKRRAQHHVVATQRKESKKETIQESYERVLEEKRAQLLRQAQLAGPAPKKASASGKTVRFSE